MAQIGRVNLYINVTDSDDPKLLNVVDASEWNHIQNKPAVIHVTLPGGTTPIIYNFVKNSVNIFNSNNLQLSCRDCNNSLVALPDGIYTIQIFGSPDTFTHKVFYLKTDQLRLELDKLYIKMGFHYEDAQKNMIDYLNKIEAFILTAKAHTRAGDINNGHRFYEAAKQLLTTKSL